MIESLMQRWIVRASAGAARKLDFAKTRACFLHFDGALAMMPGPLQLRPTTMKLENLLPVAVALLFSSCAAVHVDKTYVASGATNPRQIYIRPFSVADTVFKGN